MFPGTNVSTLTFGNLTLTHTSGVQVDLLDSLQFSCAANYSIGLCCKYSGN